jgi:hypothetical protein
MARLNIRQSAKDSPRRLGYCILVYSALASFRMEYRMMEVLGAKSNAELVKYDIRNLSSQHR